MLKHRIPGLFLVLLLAGCSTDETPEGEADVTELLSRAESELASRTPQGLRRAVSLYGQLTETDPDLAVAWAGLAEGTALMGLYGVLPPSEVMSKAAMAADRALALDSENALIHAIRGLVSYLHEWNWKEAEASFARAIELDSNLVEPLHWSAMMYSALGRDQEATARIRQAVGINPGSPLLAVKVGTILANGDQFQEAHEVLAAATRRFPGFAMGWNERGLLALREGDHPAAIDFFRRALEVDVGSERALAGLAVSLARNDAPEELVEIEGRLKELAAKGHVSPEILAELRLAQGSAKAAIDLLEEAYEMRDPGLVYVLKRPGLRPLWEEVAFQKLVTRIGLRPSGWKPGWEESELSDTESHATPD